jgi:methyl-accepting chemotaxis protein
MASQNVDHARQAAEFTREVGHDSDAASAALAELVQAMTSIAGSAKSISGVLRIIDELAFQTNILALNAAVEAARAGEAGAGFAVVADEVRSLAQRSASASRDTSALVDQSMESVSAGQERLHRVDEALRRIVEKIGKLGAHVSDVANSSSEQTNGLTQISTAIEQIERGVQESAASAEERVAASEELTSHARLLRTTAVDLADMMGTTGG